MHAVDHTDTIISVRDISFARGETEVLKQVNLEIHRGDYLGIVGGNGAGKTTLIKLILGLLAPDSGSIQLYGTDVAQFKDWQKIGYVPQKVTNFDANFPATVEEVALMGRYGACGLFHDVTPRDREKVRIALDHVEMGAFRNRLIGDLSGGQQQRVFIARALAGEPEIVFLDEPTVGIEAHVRDEFYALLKRMNEKLHLTVVLVTHDMESMMHEAMHVACLDRALVFHDSVDTELEHSHVAHPHL